ncbi:MAG TPA: DNA polymerase III subunit delta [Bryobacteraceae bacterium]|jgi:DNA polymerase-3 subunit delta
MTPEQFRRDLTKNPPAPLYLFVGSEGYERGRCRKALIKAVLGVDSSGEAGDAFTHLDLSEIKIDEALDDARSMSLFVTRRLIWISSAEAVLPKGKAISDDPESGHTAGLNAYAKRPSPDVVVVFECSRYDYDNSDDKPRLERLHKFYAALKQVVEFKALSAEMVRAMAQDIVRKTNLQIGLSELGQLIEACAGDAFKVTNELEKLSLYAGTSRKITSDDLAAMVPNARTSTIFALVAALGRGDRTRSLDILDSLIREGEYLPLALTFVASQFRYALVAHEAKLRSSQAIIGHFTKLGIRLWGDRAAQVFETMNAFSQARTEKAIRLLFETDRGLRDARPDDRSVFEHLILELTD